MKLFFVLFFLMAGCASLHEKRLDELNDAMDRARVELSAAQASGDPAAIDAAKEKIAALKGEAERESEFIRTELDSRQALILAIIGIVSGGLKIAADKFGKAVA